MMIGTSPQSRRAPASEADLRRVLQARTKGRRARFLAIVEPYRDQPLIRAVTAVTADRVRVELSDGRTQEIANSNFAGDGQNMGITLTETRSGKQVDSIALPQPASE